MKEVSIVKTKNILTMETQRNNKVYVYIGIWYIKKIKTDLNIKYIYLLISNKKLECKKS